MEKTPAKCCAFCGQKAGRELGGLQNTPDKRILAHHNCLIFSPLVVTKDSEDEDEAEFDIQSVLEEIKRGKTLKCSYCKKSGATIGCDIKRCHKTYHYECVRKDKGITDDEKYIVWCSKHAKHSNAAEDTERSRTPDRSSPSHENDVPEKTKRKSEPSPSQVANKKSKVAQDTGRSGSSDGPSTSHDNKTLRRSIRNSEPGVYLAQLENKRSNVAQEIESISSSRSSSSHETPKTRCKSKPGQISNQNVKHTRRIRDHSEDEETNTNDASSGSNLKTTESASSVTPPARRGRPPKRRQEAASPQSRHNTSTAVTSEHIQRSDGGAEREEVNAQPRSMEEGSPAQARNTEEGSPAQARNTEEGSPAQGRNTEEGSPAQGRHAESNEERTTALSHHTLDNFCIPSTSQACCDKSEAYFLKLYESQCRIANSIESGVSEFRNFVQQFQIMFKQFLDICQSLNHGISSNLRNAHEQNTSLQVHHRQDGTPGTLPPFQLSSHFPVFTQDSANSAQNGEMSSSGNTLPSNADEHSRKARSSLPVKKRNC